MHSTRLTGCGVVEGIVDRPQIVTRAKWLAARRGLLAREKELTRALDGLNAARRRLPMHRDGRRSVRRGMRASRGARHRVRRRLARTVSAARRLPASDFNYDFHVSLDPAVTPSSYNYQGVEVFAGAGQEWLVDYVGEQPGVSAFLRESATRSSIRMPRTAAGSR